MNYYKRVNANGDITTVESYSHNLPVEGAIPITKEVFDQYIASLPPAVVPPKRNITQELDNLKEVLRVNGVIGI